MTPDDLVAVIQQVLNEHRRDLAAGTVTSALVGGLGTAFGSRFATYWQVDIDTLQLAPAHLWNRAGLAAEMLSNATKNRRLSMSEGTAGQVWRSRRPVWTTNLMRDMCLPRSLGADIAGLRAGIWFPVKTHRAVFGVMELLTTDLPPAKPEHMALIEDLGHALGRSLAGAHD